MNFKEIEKNIKNDVETIFSNILKKYDYILPISARSRSGAEISDYLEDAFMDYMNSNGHEHLYNHKSAPKGSTKNPYDICFNYKTSDYDFDDLIWGDIKATKFTYNDSNPDLGTPEKIIKFIMDGHFYLLFIFLEYEETSDNKTKFRKLSNDKYVYCQFLKDINSTVRINPKPQFQVNINQPEEYRTIDEFIDLFHTKYQESIDRNIKIQTDKKAKLDKRFEKVREMITKYPENVKIKD